MTNALPYIKRLIELIRYGGLIFALKKASQIIKNRDKLCYQDRRPDNIPRWEFISQNLSENHTSLVDIGCAEGEFCRRAESIGLEVIGYDYSPLRIAIAKKNTNVDNIEFRRTVINPDTVSSLPESDVYLLLTVHHHWVRDFGWEESRIMFNEICGKCSILFWEPPGHFKLKEWNRSEKIEKGGALDYYDSLLLDDLNVKVRILNKMVVEYSSLSNRRDPLYAIDCTKC